jgi:hypothetical protein
MKTICLKTCLAHADFLVGSSVHMGLLRLDALRQVGMSVAAKVGWSGGIAAPGGPLPATRRGASWLCIPPAKRQALAWIGVAP